MNILVTGACGQLGREIRMISRNSRDSYVFTDVSGAPGTEYLDITDAEAVGGMVREENIGAVINCAAYTDVEKAEDEPLAADLVNHRAVAVLAGAMKSCGGLLVHVSTDYVFGSEPYNVPCTEEQKGTPVGVYGKTKLAGEKAVLASGCRHVIIRTSWLYSE